MVKSKQSAKTQAEQFIAAARELGCDEDESHFEKTLKKVARHKLPNAPVAKPQPKPKNKTESGL